MLKSDMLIVANSTTCQLLTVKSAIELNCKFILADWTGEVNSSPRVSNFAIITAKELACFRVLDLACQSPYFFVAVGALHGNRISNSIDFSACFSCLICWFGFSQCGTLFGAVDPGMISGHEILLTLRAGTGLFVSRLLMVEREGTHAASFTPPGSRFSTISTCLFSSVAEIYSMYLSMAVNTKGNSIGHIKTGFWILCPWFYMMRLYFAFSPTLLACIVISNVYCVAPFPKFCSQSCSLTFKRLPIFPSRSINPYFEFLPTCPGTKLLSSFFWNKAVSAIEACYCINYTAMRPALFGAIKRCLSSVCVCFIFFAAYLASKCNSVSFQLSSPLKILYNVQCMYFITYVDILQGKDRIDVCISCWEQLTGQEATLIERVEEVTYA